MNATATRERPILFSGPMIRAILDGRKTQTRRLIKPQPVSIGDQIWEFGDEVFTNDSSMADHLFHNVYGTKGTPYGSVMGDGAGDRLWVRETWAPMEPSVPIEPGDPIAYREDYADDPHGYDGEKSPEGKYRTWRPSIHMPRWASRLMLEITDVRVQRLQDITEDDAIAEGAQCCPEFPASLTDRGALGRLWEKINGEGSWKANPWVWCLTFKRVD